DCPELLPELRRRLDAPADCPTASEAPPDSCTIDSPPSHQTWAGPTFLRPPQAAGELGRLGPYRVIQILGQGGMGMVFLAEDLGVERRVALKVTLPKIAADPIAKARFLREAKLAASIEHDHVVTIHQVGEDNGVPFLAMQLLQGEPL